MIRRIAFGFLRRITTTALVLTLSACVGPRSISMDSSSDSTTASPIGWGSAPRNSSTASSRGTSPDRNRAATSPSSRRPTTAEPAARIGPPVVAAALPASSGERGSVDDGGLADTPKPPSAPKRSACIDPLEDTEPLYALPYEVGAEFEVRQGTCGPVTHRGAFSFSYDFDMPPGTPIVAARGGIVASVVEGHPENTNRSRHANYVVIEHEDGQFSRYLHLKTDGVTVAEGDTVHTGDLIAYSGNSGRSSRPHLHFDVTNGCGRVSSGCPTLPTTFMNSDEKAPRGGQRYVALPY